MAEAESSHLLPQLLVESIERQTGGRITDVVPRAGGGASRAGAEVGVILADGSHERGYLSWDTRLGDVTRPPAFEREAAILSALSGLYRGRGVNAPRLIATEPAMFALFTALVPGTDKWITVEPEAERIASAHDFVRQIAALHAIDPREHPLPGFGDPGIPTSQRVREKLRELRQLNLATTPDAILLLAIQWLEENVPPDDGPPVIVHGDAGPLNFLNHEGQCTALLDWELTHYGDPMEDLAGVWVRMLFNPFIPMREVIEAYVAASGRKVDIVRVKYFRLFFQISFTVPSRALDADAKSLPAMAGTRMLFSTAHLRIIVQQIAELSGLALDTYDAPNVMPTQADRAFQIALDDIRQIIVPRASDQLAAGKAKSIARMIKFWRQRERYGATYDRLEIGETERAIGGEYGSLAEARHALAHAVAGSRVDRITALNLCNRRMLRETELMGDAMGWFKTTYFPHLD
ncbi:MAG: phosphotransferase family protein [Sphingomonadaceae bacterium]|nr:phosphotransferase family protein [Sphingomonadaceae bacterium]